MNYRIRKFICIGIGYSKEKKSKAELVRSDCLMHLFCFPEWRNLNHRWNWDEANHVSKKCGWILKSSQMNWFLQRMTFPHTKIKISDYIWNWKTQIKGILITSQIHVAFQQWYTSPPSPETPPPPAITSPTQSVPPGRAQIWMLVTDWSLAGSPGSVDLSMHKTFSSWLN